MSTIRVIKSNNYSVINNTVLNDDRISWEAKGLAAYLLSKPDDWRINTNQLWQASANGHGSVKRVLRELEGAGYLRRTRTRRPNGSFEWDHALYEVPQIEEPEAPAATAADLDVSASGRKPSDGYPSTGYPSTGEPSHGNHPTETIGWKPSDILSTEDQVLSTKDNDNNELPPSLSSPEPEAQPEPPKPAATEVDPSDWQRVRTTYEGNFGMFTPLLADRVRDALRQHPVEMIVLAMERAISAERRRWDYVEGILRNWAVEGYSNAAKTTVGNSKPASRAGQPGRTSGGSTSRPPAAERTPQAAEPEWLDEWYQQQGWKPPTPA